MLDLRLPHGLSPGLDLLCLANSVLRFREGSSEEPPLPTPPGPGLLLPAPCAPLAPLAGAGGVVKVCHCS